MRRKFRYVRDAVAVITLGVVLGTALYLATSKAQGQSRPLYEDPFQPRRDQAQDFYRDYMRDLERERQRKLEEQDRNRRQQDSWTTQETNCFYGRDHFNKCR